MFGDRWSSQASATCIGVTPRRFATVERVDDCNGVKPPQREERHIGDALPGQVVDEGIIAAVGHVVVVLHADDLRDGLRLGHLRGG